MSVFLRGGTGSQCLCARGKTVGKQTAGAAFQSADTSPAPPTHPGLKPGIPPLQVLSFGLEYRCPIEE